MIAILLAAILVSLWGLIWMIDGVYRGLHHSIAEAIAQQTAELKNAIAPDRFDEDGTEHVEAEDNEQERGEIEDDNLATQPARAADPYCSGTHWLAQHKMNPADNTCPVCGMKFDTDQLSDGWEGSHTRLPEHVPNGAVSPPLRFHSREVEKLSEK